LKKILLKKAADYQPGKSSKYKVNYSKDLNPAQYEAVFHNDGAALVIAGAGTGKTMTLTYRVSRLVEDGVPPESILLLTFTRKASSEMLRRASNMLDGRCEKVSGGTFHSFALLTLRNYATMLGYDQGFTVLDGSDIEDTINLIRSQMKFDKSKKRFPQKDTLAKIFNLTVNKRKPIEDIILNDFPFFFEEIDNIVKIFEEYNSYKSRYNLMDYDDLLLNLLNLLKLPAVRSEMHRKYRFVMVDEYQDTNKLQHEIVLHLTGKTESVMAVGDDAQSIYSFRGAEFQNIMDFPNSFNKCNIYKIEENYRSTQPILTLTNKIISEAAFKYEKELFTSQTTGEMPKIIAAENERQQSLFITQQILELREEGFALDDIAVLFRSGFLSFDLEIELIKANIPYKKFGGMKFIETAHIKDILSFFKIVNNPKDAVSWHRVLLQHDGVGPRTASKIIDMITREQNFLASALAQSNISKGQENIQKLFRVVKDLNSDNLTIGEKATLIIDYYKPMFKKKYDDWQKRWKDVDMFLAIAERYKSMTEFLNDMAIEPPTESVVDLEPETKEEEFLSLSTIHSAKGLEWRAVFIIWALDGRFPSSKAADSENSLEEERRLFYVACTRAKEKLYISYPTNIYDRESGIVLSKPSRFLDTIGEEIADRFILEDWEENTN